MAESKIAEALQLTSEIFSNVEASHYKYKGYEVVWAIYSLVHTRFSIPFCEIKETLEDAEAISLEDLADKYRDAARIYAAATGKPLLTSACEQPLVWERPAARIRALAKDMLLVAYSLVSVLIGRLAGRRKVAVWTGDFFSRATGGDFRLGSLYRDLRAARVYPIDFIRQDMNGFANTVKNMLRRRRLAVYYSSIDALVRRLAKKDALPVALKREHRLHRQVLQSYLCALKGHQAVIRVFEFLFRLLGVRAFVAWELSDRQAHLIVAAKCQGVRVIGFQHGAGMETYMAHEFMREFTGAQKIGPDFMGVWSAFWLQYFRARSQLYGSIEVSGPIRPLPQIGTREKKSKPVRRILWISEPLADVGELEPYILFIHANYELLIRKRPSTKDVFFSELAKRQPALTACGTSSGSIAQAVAEVDLVVGSHSTAVLEAAVIGTPLLLIKTQRWGDYFELSEKVKDYHIVVDSIESLRKSIAELGQRDVSAVLHEIAVNYLGDRKRGGTEWLVHRIEECLVT
jgi:hypothetical protein